MCILDPVYRGVLNSDYAEGSTVCLTIAALTSVCLSLQAAFTEKRTGEERRSSKQEGGAKTSVNGEGSTQH